MTIFEIIILYLLWGITYMYASHGAINNNKDGILNALLIILLWPICLILEIYIDIKVFINKKKHE